MASEGSGIWKQLSRVVLRLRPSCWLGLLSSEGSAEAGEPAPRLTHAVMGSPCSPRTVGGKLRVFEVWVSPRSLISPEHEI